MDNMRKGRELFVDSKEDGAQRRLNQLGYEQTLNRELSVFGNVVMALSNVSPVMAAFVYALAAFATVGAATGPAAILQGINVILIGLILGELASMYPISGGLYSIINYILPKPLVFMAVFTFMIQAFIYPPSIAMGVAQYLQILFPGLPQGALACSGISAAVFFIALIIGLNSIVLSNRVAKIFLALQMVVLVVFLYVCFANPQRSLGDVVFHSEMLDGNGGLTPVTFGAVLMGIGILCACIDGYGASVGFSEETKGSCRDVGKAQFISATTTAVLIVVVLLAAMIAAPSILDFLNSGSPMLYTMEAYLGTKGAAIINIGIIISSFSCLVVIINYMARVLYTGARDRIWPGKMNDLLSKVSGKSKSPWAAMVLISAVDMILVFASDIVTLITFGGMAAAVVYLLIAAGSINSRIHDKISARPFKMPLFPLPSIIVIIFLIIALFSQTATDVAIVGGLLALSLIYYFAYIRPRDKREEKAKVKEGMDNE